MKNSTDHPNEKEPIVIVGAGSTGLNAALMLDKLGHKVTLIDIAPHLLAGAPMDTYILHGDGFEYHHPSHQKTGEYCIDGTLAKRLIYPRKVYQTQICNISHNPIRFFVSENSAAPDMQENSHVPVESFENNVIHMKNHFTKRYEQTKETYKLTDAETDYLLGRNPDSFAHKLQEFSGVDNVVLGYAGSSKGINMPQYYAYLKAAVRESNIRTIFNNTIEAVEERSPGKYTITTTDGEKINTGYVMLAASHGNPELTEKFTGAKPKTSGTYYLNTMLYVRLPKTGDKKKIDDATKINFILQQENGCAYTCLVPPSAEQEGTAIIYYPSEKGNQVEKHVYDANNPKKPPSEWENIIKDGLDISSSRVQNIMDQACKFYPFLKDYAKPYQAVCRTVFNAASPDSTDGLDRRVRDIPATDEIKKNVISVHAPKWTNAELVALTATDHILKCLGAKELPKHKDLGYGPSRLDILEISKTLNFQNVKDIKYSDAQEYAKWQGLPEVFVQQNLLTLITNKIIEGDFTKKLLEERADKETQRQVL